MNNSRRLEVYRFKDLQNFIIILDVISDNPKITQHLKVLFHLQ
jgi:hypothetical protein